MVKKQINEKFDIFDKEEMKKQILDRYEKNNKGINFKWVLIPICLLIVIGSLLWVNLKDNNLLQNESYIDQENNLNLNFNQIKKLEELMSDADIKIDANDINMPWPDILMKGLKLPEDLTKTSTHAVFTKDSKTNDYTNLNCYVYNYYNEDDNRNIRMAFSENEKPLRDYYFKEDNFKKSYINNYELVIYQYKEIYFVEFTYKGFNFDIETSKIEEKELLAFLVSIIR